MAHEFKYRKFIEFSETDAAGIMHFSNYFRFMEITEHAFFRDIGLQVHSEAPGEQIGWPRVHSECDYSKPLTFGDEVEIHLRVVEKRRKTLVFEFIFRKIVEGKPIHEVARGKLITVCAIFNDRGRIKGSTPIPAEVADFIDIAPEELAPVV